MSTENEEAHEDLNENTQLKSQGTRENYMYDYEDEIFRQCEAQSCEKNNSGGKIVTNNKNDGNQYSSAVRNNEGGHKQSGVVVIEESSSPGEEVRMQGREEPTRRISSDDEDKRRQSRDQRTKECSNTTETLGEGGHLQSGRESVKRSSNVAGTDEIRRRHSGLAHATNRRSTTETDHQEEYDIIMAGRIKNSFKVILKAIGIIVQLIDR